MIFTLFVAVLAGFWFLAALTAFCPVRSYRRRRELQELEGED